MIPDHLPEGEQRMIPDHLSGGEQRVAWTTWSRAKQDPRPLTWKGAEGDPRPPTTAEKPCGDGQSRCNIIHSCDIIVLLKNGIHCKMEPCLPFGTSETVVVLAQDGLRAGQCHVP